MSIFNCKVVEAIPVSISESVDDGKLTYTFHSKNRCHNYFIDLSYDLVKYYLENYKYAKVQGYYATYHIHSKKTENG